MICGRVTVIFRPQKQGLKMCISPIPIGEMHILRPYFLGRKMTVTRPKIIRKSIFLVFHKLLIISSKTSKKVRKKIFRAVFEVQKTYFCHFSNGFFGFQNVQKVPILGYAPTCRGWLGCDKNRKNPKSPKMGLNTQKLSQYMILGHSDRFWRRQVPYTSKLWSIFTVFFSRCVQSFEN